MTHNPYESPFDRFTDKPISYAPPAPKQSGLGIASFALSLLAGVELFACVGLATYFAASLQGEFDEESPQAIMVGLGIMGGLGLAVIGLGLGLAGAVQSNRNKIFAILGLIFNTLLFVAICGLMGLGLAVG
jgi:hypothetical protein